MLCESCKGLGCADCRLRGHVIGAVLPSCRTDVPDDYECAIDRQLCQVFPVDRIPVIDKQNAIIGTAENVRPDPDDPDKVVCDVVLNQPAEKLTWQELSRRRKIYYVDRSILLELLRGMTTEYVMFPIIETVPEGATVLEVHDDYCRRALAVVVAHPSFDVVPDGAMTPSASESLCSFTFRRTEHRRVDQCDSHPTPSAP